jgi:hypothetical protein
MALINTDRLAKKSKLKINMNAELFEKVKKYCQWANIEDISFFFEEIAYYVLSKDKEWKNQSKTTKRKYNKKVMQEA